MKVTLILKPTYACNVQCLHCSVGDKTDRRIISPEQAFTYLEKFFRFLRLAGIDCSELDLVWHGGEPMLAGPGFYYRFKSLADKLPGSLLVNQGIQTNLLLYGSSPAWKKVFRDIFEWRVGTSYDFFSSIRPYSEDVFLKVAKKVQDDSGLPLFVICVLNSENISQVEQIFAKGIENGFYVKFNFLYPAGRGKNLVQPSFQRYTDAIKETVRLSKKHGYPVYPFYYFVGESRSDRFGFVCNFTSKCWDYIFYVNPSGYLYKCALSEDLGFSPFGNLLTDSPESLLLNYLHWKAEFWHVPDSCFDCELAEKCYGGCPVYRKRFAKNINCPSPLCGVTKLMYKEAKNCLPGREVEFYEREESEVQ